MSREIRYNFVERAVIYGVSSFVGILFSVLSLLLAAGIMLAGDMPEQAASVISAICLGLGALLSGFFSSKKIKNGGIINGLICGGVIYLIVLFISLFLSENGFSLITILNLAITLLTAAIGGIFGVSAASKNGLY